MDLRSRVRLALAPGSDRARRTYAARRSGHWDAQRSGLHDYLFFTEADPQNEGIWRNGTIYVVPSQAFARTWIPNEWVCRHLVPAVAKLAVTPADFPFPQRVKQLDPHLSLLGNIRRF